MAKSIVLLILISTLSAGTAAADEWRDIYDKLDILTPRFGNCHIQKNEDIQCYPTDFNTNLTITIAINEITPEFPEDTKGRWKRRNGTMIWFDKHGYDGDFWCETSNLTSSIGQSVTCFAPAISSKRSIEITFRDDGYPTGMQLKLIPIQPSRLRNLSIVLADTISLIY